MYFTVVGRGPMNTFSRFRAFPTAEFKEVVRPNFDTLYSSGWLDLTKERWSSLFQTRRVATICCRCWTCGLMFSLFPASVRRVQAPPTAGPGQSRHRWPEKHVSKVAYHGSGRQRLADEYRHSGRLRRLLLETRHHCYGRLGRQPAK